MVAGLLLTKWFMSFIKCLFNMIKIVDISLHKPSKHTECFHEYSLSASNDYCPAVYIT